MPNRYEREIEEILRNLDGGEPKSSRGPRFGERSRRKPGPSTRQRSRGLSLHLRAVDVFLIIALGAALFGGGYAYAQGPAGPNILTGVLAIIGIVCLLCMAIAPFLSRASAPPSRYKVTPLSRNPLSNLAVRWNLFMLKWRYRRRRDH